MNVLLVSTWQTTCGIAEHSAMLKEAVEQADPTITITPDAEGLDPYKVLYAIDWTKQIPDVIHLNYHAALHSRWQPLQIDKVQALGAKVLVTYHDTGVPNSDQCKAICAAADYFVVHEPYDDLPAHGEYLRMGVPEYAGRRYPVHPHAYQRPIVGTVGHDFGWKNWDALATWAKVAGWGVRICTPAIADAHAAVLHAANPWLELCVGLDRHDLLAALHNCDATAFVNVCHNAGQSGAILQGIAARKPVIALSTCRQFRALAADPLGAETILWCRTFEEVAARLRLMPIQRVDPGIVALAEQESWTRVGARYAAIYQALAANRQPEPRA